MTKLYLTRHGQTQWNVERRMQGQHDSPLTELGEQQARWLGERLQGVAIDLIASSSSGRAVRTAELIWGERPIPVSVDDNLREINLGAWEGMLHSEVERIYPEEHYNFWHYPHLYQPVGGETFPQAWSRLTNAVEQLLSAYPNQTILVVTHAVALKTLLAYFAAKELKDLWTGAYMKSTCLNLIEIENGSRRIVMQGDVSHYRE